MIYLLLLNLETILDGRQYLVDENLRLHLPFIDLRRQNSKRIHHHYMVGDKINVKTIDPVKMSEGLLYMDHSLSSKPTPTKGRRAESVVRQYSKQSLATS